MTVMKQRAIDMINRMPEEKLYYIIQLLEGVEGLSGNKADGFETQEQRALKDLQRFRRKPYYDLAYNILSMCADKKVYGHMAAHSIPNLFYILRKSMPKEDRREALKDICQIIKVEGIDSFKILSALDNEDFSDFADCLQEECAVAISADYIVTRNAKDSASSRVPVILPDQFLEKYKDLLS